MITALSIIGTRPEAIKMAPVIGELRRRREQFRCIVCSTGQHREMLRQVTDLFGFQCDVDLDLMTPNQTLAGITARLFESLDRVLVEQRPDWVLVQGDTTTAFVAATVAYYHRVKVGHIEAGLRTGDKWRPFPEEVNRRFVDVVADLYFAPTAFSREALLREHTAAASIHVTGNTVVDAVLEISKRPYDWSAGPLAKVHRDYPIVLITAHRRESFGPAFREMCIAIRELAQRHAHRDVQFVYPVHLNPNVRAPVQEILSGLSNLQLLAPIDYHSLIQLLKHSTLVLTDSGGIQEEAPAFGVPVLVMRDTTERPEGVEAGVARLVGTSHEAIVREASRLLSDAGARQAMRCAANPYGDGHAAERIAQILLGHQAYSESE
jgi:UDP-N-acetylglucosamine 2-epimerase